MEACGILKFVKLREFIKRKFTKFKFSIYSVNTQDEGVGQL